MGATSDLLPQGLMTNLLTMDEKAEWIVEFEKDKPRFGTHRYQVIQVRRGKTLCDFQKDLGPSFLYPNAPPMQQASPQQSASSGYSPEFPSGLLAQAPSLLAPPRKPPDLRALRAALARPQGGVFFGRTS